MSSSFDRLDFDFRFARGLRTVCERPRTVREKIFRTDSPRLNHGQSDFSRCGSIGSECFFGQSACGGPMVRDPFAHGPPVPHGQSAQAFAVQSLCFGSCLFASASCS
jgi:hypothetical protein